MSKPTLVLLTDNDNTTMLITCSTEEEAERVAASAVFSSGGVSAWKIAGRAIPASERLRDLLRDGHGIGDLVEVLEQDDVKSIPQVVLTENDPATLRSTFDSARRGREDFEYLVSQNAGDYEEDDIAETRSWHEREKALEKRLHEALKED